MLGEVSSRINEVPLKDELNDLPEGRIKALEGADKKVVRIEHSIHEHTDKIIKEAKEAKKGFRELQRKYGVHVINYETIIGKDEKGEKVVYMIADKIEGTSLSMIEHIPLEEKEEFENFYLGLLNYIEGKFKQKALCFLDIKNDQFMYGHKVGQTINRIYLVDVEPQFYNFADIDEVFSLHMFEKSIEDILEDIENLEKSFTQPTTLTQARQKAKRLIEFVAWLRQLRNQEDQKNL